MANHRLKNKNKKTDLCLQKPRSGVQGRNRRRVSPGLRGRGGEGGCGCCAAASRDPNPHQPHSVAPAPKTKPGGSRAAKLRILRIGIQIRRALTGLKPAKLAPEF